jgi:hypothetical protein
MPPFAPPPPRHFLTILVVISLLASGCRSAAVPDRGGPPEPPPAPEGLELAVVRYDGVALRWEPCFGAVAYRVYRDGVPISRCSDPRFLDLGAPLLNARSHEYAVSAIGERESLSARSAARATSTEFPRAAVPEPVLDERPEFVDLYYSAWALAWTLVRGGTRDSDRATGFPFPHLAPSHAEIRSSDAWLAVDLARHGYPLLPVTGVLDAFHAAQQSSAELVETLGSAPVKNGEAAEASAAAAAPGALASAEWLLFTATGDLDRLRRVRGPLEARFARARGMERGRVAFAAEQAIAAEALANISLALGDEPSHSAWSEARREIRDRVNARNWDEEDQVYYDLAADGSRKRQTTLDSFRPLAAGIPDRTRAAALVYHLEDPSRFKRPNRFPNLAASDSRYRPDGEAGAGAVEEYANALLVRGLAEYGFDDLARSLTEGRLACAARVHAATGRFFDAYAPESAAPAGSARAGIAAAPVAGLLRYGIGISTDAPSGTLLFRVSSLGRHGVRRLRLGRRVVSIVCAERRAEGDPCDVEVETDGPLSVVVSTPWAEFPIPRIEAGSHRFRLMRPPGTKP